MPRWTRRTGALDLEPGKWVLKHTLTLLPSHSHVVVCYSPPCSFTRQQRGTPMHLPSPRNRQHGTSSVQLPFFTRALTVWRTFGRRSRPALPRSSLGEPLRRGSALSTTWSTKKSESRCLTARCQSWTRGGVMDAHPALRRSPQKSPSVGQSPEEPGWLWGLGCTSVGPMNGENE